MDSVNRYDNKPKKGHKHDLYHHFCVVIPKFFTPDDDTSPRSKKTFYFIGLISFSFFKN